MLIHAVLAFALLETLALAVVLWIWAHRVPGARLLVLFLAGVAVWVVGNELPNWVGPEVEPLAIKLVSSAPVVSAVFLHFCVVFCRVPLGRIGLGAAYALGGASTLLAWVRSPGYLIHAPSFGWVAVPTTVGLVASVAWVVLGITGLSVLAVGFMRASQPRRSQIAAVGASCVWGALCLAGYLMAAMQLPMTPWPLFGLPAYSLILVYGILRYRVFVVNAWARRALAWTLLLALGAGVVALTPLLPFESRWLGGLAVAVSCLALNGPVRRVAERLIFPGGQVSVNDLAAWRTALQPAETPVELAAIASGLIGSRVGLEVPVVVGEGAGEAPLPSSDVPSLHCTRGADGWRCQLLGWDAAPPGPRHAAEMFGAVLADAAARVEQAQVLAARERERQLQARLAELGALAATVAHDIRNPLNIISMAVAAAPSATRREVADQVGRISHLTSDLLDYAKPWKLNPAPLDLAARVRALALRWPAVSLGPGLDAPLWIEADARRLDQALTNLLENANTAVAAGPAPAEPDAQGGVVTAAPRTRTRVHLDADRSVDAVRLHVCDDGPGVPPEIRERLFEPFASRSAGGTGLGLAIVARILAAHGGSVALSERAPWSTCFTLTFPARP
ncbi:sensor histidine kinase [Ideonella sp. BN130291]|uniref:sensor histidine kinase n=1 Tax=Ideonella sp. BN130291 TaxID=3112940 RepID=UPI002E26057F|nr:ATP-binding protein [Ideonella sp. BN130291]